MTTFFLNHYTCTCGHEWSDTESTPCDADCGSCGVKVSPQESEEIEELEDDAEFDMDEGDEGEDDDWSAYAEPVGPRPPAPPRRPDLVADRLNALGFGNEYVLDLNGSVTVPYDWEMPWPWNLSSRAFRFPVAISKQPADGERKLAVMHTALNDHPLVMRLRAEGFEVSATPDPELKSGSEWWHAIDLATNDKMGDLLKTREFTSDAAILRAVSYGVHYRHLKVSNARALLFRIGAEEPHDVAALIDVFAKPSSCTHEKKTYWPVNSAFGDEFTLAQKAWAMITGVERGWFTYDRSGHVNWTQLGRDTYASPRDAIVVAGAAPQMAFAF